MERAAGLQNLLWLSLVAAHPSCIVISPGDESIEIQPGTSGESTEQAAAWHSKPFPSKERRR